MSDQDEVTTWRVPRESVEWVGPLQLLLDGEPAVLQVALVSGRDRPTEQTWTDPTVLQDRPGVLLDGTREPGTYRVWVRPTAAASPERPVLLAGTVVIT